MMFLQYALWGAWLPVTARYLSASISEGGLGFTGSQIGMILGLAGSIGAIAAPFIAGQIADRYFSTEKILAFLVTIGGMVKWYTALQTDYESWLVLSILYSVLYMPTLALSNSITFAHIDDQENDFPKIRVWGTIGWIAASWAFPMIWLQTNLQFQAMPPFIAGAEVPNVKLAFKKAFELFQHSSFTILVISSLTVSIIHQIYFLQTGPFLSYIGVPDSQIGPAMTIGQFAEILTMAYLGTFLKRLGFKKVITIGIAAYFLRYAIFGTEILPVWVMIMSQAFHGFCYAFFFAAAYVYVDKIAEEDVRHSAQTVFGIIILGGGPVIGGWLSGYLQNEYTSVNRFPGPDQTFFDYSMFWYTLSLIGLATATFFYFSFKYKKFSWK